MGKKIYIRNTETYAEKEFYGVSGKVLVDKHGYIRTPEGKRYDRECYKKKHGDIPEGYIIYHIDSCKTNNEIKNLFAMPIKFHDYICSLQRKNGIHFSYNDLNKLLTEWEIKYIKVQKRLNKISTELKCLKTSEYDLRLERKRLNKQLEKLDSLDIMYRRRFKRASIPKPIKSISRKGKVITRDLKVN